MLTLVSDRHHKTYNQMHIVEKSPRRMGNLLIRDRYITYSTPYPHILHILYKNGKLEVHLSMLTTVIDSHHTTYNKIDIVEKSPHRMGNVLVRHRQHSIFTYSTHNIQEW